MADRKLPELRSRLRLDTSDLDKAAVKAKAFTKAYSGPISTANLDAFAAKAGKLGDKMTRNITLPVAAVGIATTKMAMDFNRAFTLMATLGGVTADEIDGLKKAVQKLADETGQSPDDLAKALYLIRSAGIEGADALKVLEVSAQGARIGLGDTATVADAVTSALNTYAAQGLTATEVTDQLAAAVKAGKGEASEFAPQLGRLLPIAQNLGIGFDQVAGSMAFLTKGGLNAANAATELSGIMQKILRPSQQGADVLASVGLSADSLRQSVKDKGLLATLEDLQQRLGGNSDALGKVFEDTEGLTGVLALLNNNGKDAAEIIDSVTNSSGDLAAAVAKVRGTSEDKFQRDLAHLSNAAIDLGEKLIPLLGEITDDVSGMLGTFNRLPDSLQNGLLALAGFAAVMGPIAKAVQGGTVALKGLMKAAEAVKGVDLAGAATNVKLLVAGFEGAGVIAGTAAAGFGILVGQFLSVQAEAKHAKEDVDSLKSAIEGGASPAEAFNAKLARTLAGASGGFSLRGTGERFRAEIEASGVSAKELGKLLIGSEADYKKFKDSLGDGAFAHALIYNLDNIRGRALKAKDQEAALDSANKQLGVGAEKTAPKIDDQAAAIAGLVDPSQQASDALLDQAHAARDLFDAHQNETQAAEAVTSAQADVAAARQSGADAIRQATDAVTEAEKALASAQVDSRKAQEELSKARADAAKEIEDLARASADARLEEASAAIDLAEAKRKLQEGNFDGPIEQARAELGVQQAQQKLTDQQAAAAQAAKDAAEAKRKGVEGSDGVLAAQERIADALGAEQEARKRIGEATADVAKAQTEAATRVREAEDKVTEAQLAHVEAQADLAEKTGDVGKATDILILGLTALAQTLDPNDPLRKNLTSYIADLKDLHDLMTGPGSEPSSPTRPPSFDEPGTRPPSFDDPPRALRHPSSVGPSRIASTSGTSAGAPNIAVSVNVNGDPDAVALARMKEVASSAVVEGLRKASFK